MYRGIISKQPMVRQDYMFVNKLIAKEDYFLGEAQESRMIN